MLGSHDEESGGGGRVGWGGGGGGAWNQRGERVGVRFGNAGICPVKDD